METKKERKTIVQGILFVVASAVLFGVNPSLQKLVLQEGVTPVALIGLNYFVVAVLSFGVCCAKRKILIYYILIEDKWVSCSPWGCSEWGAQVFF